MSAKLIFTGHVLCAPKKHQANYEVLFFFLFQYCHFGRLSPWHMFSWLGGSVSHFHRFLMGWEILGRKTARRLPRSPRRDWIIRNIFLHLTFELQGSTHSFCSASSSFFFYTPTCQLHLFRLRFKSRQRSETHERLYNHFQKSASSSLWCEWLWKFSAKHSLLIKENKHVLLKETRYAHFQGHHFIQGYY